MSIVATVAIGYLLGSFPTGVVIGRIAGIGDVRGYGSGKTGFTNSLRTMGIRWAVVVLLIDAAKGAVPVLIGQVVFDEPWAAALGGVAAVIGHTWPGLRRLPRGGVASRPPSARSSPFRRSRPFPCW